MINKAAYEHVLLAIEQMKLLAVQYKSLRMRKAIHKVIDDLAIVLKLATKTNTMEELALFQIKFVEAEEDKVNSLYHFQECKYSLEQLEIIARETIQKIEADKSVRLPKIAYVEEEPEPEDDD